MNDELKVAIAGALMLAIFGFLVVAGDDLGFDAAITTDLIMLMPGALVFVVGLFLVTNLDGMYLLPGIMGLGIALAYLAGSLDTLGYISAELSVGLTISQIQVWIILLSTLVGAVATSFNDR